MFYIDQLRTQSFPIRLVKTESVRSVKSGLGRWTLVVAVINLHHYHFFGFPRPDLSLWEYRNRCFLVAQCRLIVRRPNLEVATKRLLHQQVKIQGYFFSAIFAHGSAFLQLFLVVWIFLRSLDVIWQMISQWGSQKITLRIGVSWTHSLTFYF